MFFLNQNIKQNNTKFIINRELIVKAKKINVNASTYRESSSLVVIYSK